jgi:antitoxin PrlF
MKATVSSKGQVTIPKVLRERMGITNGVVLYFREEKGKIIAERVQVESPVAAVYGLFRDGRRTEDVMRELRPEAEE